MNDSKANMQTGAAGFKKERKTLCGRKVMGGKMKSLSLHVYPNLSNPSEEDSINL